MESSGKKSKILEKIVCECESVRIDTSENNGNLFIDIDNEDSKGIYHIVLEIPCGVYTLERCKSAAAAEKALKQCDSGLKEEHPVRIIDSNNAKILYGKE